MDPPYLQALKGEWGMMKLDFFRNYHAKYMVQGKFKPAIHIITFIMCLGYALEYPHLKRAHHASARARPHRRMRRAYRTLTPLDFFRGRSAHPRGEHRIRLAHTRRLELRARLLWTSAVAASARAQHTRLAWPAVLSRSPRFFRALPLPFADEKHAAKKKAALHAIEHGH